MRKILVLLSILLVLACNKDDETSKLNSFTLDGTNYELEDGLIWLAQDWFKIELYSPGINQTAGIAGVEPVYNGTGDILYFGFLIAANEGEISNGTYTFSSQSFNSYTFSAGVIAINLDLSDYSGDIYNVISGTVDVQNNNGDVVIDFNLTLEGGKTISGNYTGSIYIWDDVANDWM
jgi:hypothetical protein